ncbi:MAG: hypothetical protein VX768_03090, partial [Planctomycetota bacterium]|nr:hypothetical protein [Planctomycetota bacterium]
APQQQQFAPQQQQFAPQQQQQFAPQQQQFAPQQQQFAPQQQQQFAPQQQQQFAPQQQQQFAQQQPEQKSNIENVSENASKVKEDLKAFGNKTLEVTGAVAEKVGTQAKQLTGETAEIYNQQGMKAAVKHLAKSFLSNKLFLIIGIVAACFAVIFFCGISWLFFGDSHEKVLEDYISEMKQLSAIVESIESVDDVDAAERRIAKRLKNIQQIKERGNKLKKPDSEKAKKLRAKYEGRIIEQVENLARETMKVGLSSGPAGSKLVKQLKGMSPSVNFF